MPNYVKIPREIIYDKELSSKRVIIFSYLCARRSLDDTVAFSITELCHWSKLKPNYRDGKINQKYYEVLLLLSHYGYFESCPDFEKCLKEKTNSVKYQQVKLNIEKFDVPDKFGIIYFDELDAILNFKEELKDKEIDTARISSAYILLVLSYIRVNLNRMDGLKRFSFDIDLQHFAPFGQQVCLRVRNYIFSCFRTGKCSWLLYLQMVRRR